MLINSIIVTASALVSGLVFANNNDVKANDKAKTEEVVLKTDATAEDLKAIDCSKLTADQLNKLSNKKTCSGLTSACLAKFDATKVCSECLGHMAASEWKELESSTVEQLIHTEPENLDFKVDHFAAILPKIHLNKVTETFAGYVVRSPEMLEIILEKGDGKLLETFITSKTLPSLPLNTFARFSKSMVSRLKDNAFTDINATQLAIIPASAFEGFEAAQWAKVNPEALNNLTREQASHLSPECWNAFSPTQIQNFGKSVSKFQQGMTAQKANQALDRRHFREQHPCNTYEETKSKLAEKTTKAFDERCKEITAFKVNASNTLSASLLALLLVSVAVVIPILY